MKKLEIKIRKTRKNQYFWFHLVDSKSFKIIHRNFFRLFLFNTLTERHWVYICDIGDVFMILIFFHYFFFHSWYSWYSFDITDIFDIFVSTGIYYWNPTYYDTRLYLFIIILQIIATTTQQRRLFMFSVFLWVLEVFWISSET